MKKIFIHIGSGKTGSSSIQTALSSYFRDKNIDIVYPAIEGTGHQNLEVMFRQNNKLSRGLKSKYSNLQLLEEYKHSFKYKFNTSLKDTNNAIISSEFLFGFSLREITLFKKHLDDLGFTDYKILAYIRSPESYYLSLIQQKIKASHLIVPPKDFKSDFAKKIQLWQNVFGKSSLIVREFNKNTLIKNDVVYDFAELISAFFSKLINLESVSTNESIAAEGMIFLQHYRSIFFKSHNDIFKKESNSLLRELIKVSHTGIKPKLKNAYRNLIISNHIEDIKFFQKNYDLFENYGDLSNEDTFNLLEPVYDNDSVGLILDGIDNDAVNVHIYNVIHNLLN